jgi:hypothetical protein
MKIKAVNRIPFFRFKCFKCEKLSDTKHEAVYADLDGPSFRAYYCETCMQFVDTNDSRLKA